MRVLAIDTATTALVTGVVDTESGQLTQRVLADTRAHNERLMPTILEVMSEAGLELGNLDAIVAGVGPGPFTGLRVGMATAQALADALSIPLHGVCTHDAIAHAALAGAEEKDAALVATDARRKEIYWATYRAGQRLAGPDVSKPGELSVQDIAQVVIPEKLADQLPEELAALPRSEAAPTAEGLVAVARLDADPAPFVPRYLRRPDAVPPKKQQLSAAIPEVRL
ncbi:tRNA (adenosine(37)-N6)-threonylcarbamoyltransferase complex dimerization subunit type 1 TsaB [Corynebacterium sp. ACRQM]|uniref:tRNA (adenosine(37)-N6)-threonylcarbamoyltransferase complex dimerization subunit type 1 TsaB n=1 Tax=unclassified Corynebacterium TaxID=2624378 RepID=UPI001EF41630|nr:tRNA (adenosine(37)-N6)-threonylcarbamoyltransferase complex dimerization subunit type 1 TsaB [Corynebacterium sp. ACRPR]MCG7234231.1 tRNA (adenosine(37)-N6)-threonylcarbamoyltransferase complex dimerization subunit type 1 TsaB [Corynebacterium sp. ACRPR]MCG7242940.1 tRNA (adenosine(37)-N6)-threonylcarbamoyltransferase complex dimerization subunit type 1 TsaB [Corynebacterium sp. ACRPS]MCG7272124.1 tRNA (adenosine(37)-N6)-threonylcarbamoyltransferase complex dimerization subunit type 1 TsaB [